MSLKRFKGNCYLCKEDKDDIRNIDLYVIGSEGLNACHHCEMTLVEFCQARASAAIETKKQQFIKRRNLDNSCHMCHGDKEVLVNFKAKPCPNTIHIRLRPY